MDKISDKTKETKYGCPCGPLYCCDNPDLYTPIHSCIGGRVCEDCYVTACHNCEKSCACDL